MKTKTLMEACSVANLPYPRTEAELRNTISHTVSLEYSSQSRIFAGLVPDDMRGIMRIKETITLPDGKKLEVLNYAPNCENCGVPCELELCLACAMLLNGPTERVGQVRSMFGLRPGGETEKFFNRRWQFYFNRNEIPAEDSSPTMPLWETKRKVQNW